MRTNGVRAMVVVTALVMTTGTLWGTGCSMFSNRPKGEWALVGSQKIPAAEGKVQVSRAGTGNETVEVSAEHLAHPGDAFPGTTTYVVWVAPAEGTAALNMGVLSLGEDLRGHFRTQTPYRNFKLMVTAEAAPNVLTPSENVAFTTMVNVPG